MIWCTLGLGYPAWNMAASMSITALSFIRPQGLKTRRVTSWVNLLPPFMMTIITLNISYSPGLWLAIWHLAGAVKSKWWLKSRCSTLSTILRLALLLKINPTPEGQQQLLLTTRTIVCWEARTLLRARMPITGLSSATQEAPAMARENSSHCLLLSLAYQRCLCHHKQGTWNLSN